MLDLDRFCAVCGKPATAVAGNYQVPPRPLERDMFNKRLGGVCAGFANYLGVDVTMFRIAFALCVVFAGVPVILYVVGWIMMPRNDRRALDQRNFEVTRYPERL